MSGFDDDVLRMFIDQVFDQFDYDKDGTLSVNQLHTFFNKLYIQLNDPRRFTAEEMKQYVQTFDLKQNGLITKPELFGLFKNITSGHHVAGGHKPVESGPYGGGQAQQFGQIQMGLNLHFGQPGYGQGQQMYQGQQYQGQGQSPVIIINHGNQGNFQQQ